MSITRIVMPALERSMENSGSLRVVTDVFPPDMVTICKTREPSGMGIALYILSVFSRLLGAAEASPAWSADMDTLSFRGKAAEGPPFSSELSAWPYYFVKSRATAESLDTRLVIRFSPLSQQSIVTIYNPLFKISAFALPPFNLSVFIYSKLIGVPIFPKPQVFLSRRALAVCGRPPAPSCP
jgi:hypothetical protein